MANINVKFNGKEYLLSCEDGQEEHLHELAHNLNDKFYHYILIAKASSDFCIDDNIQPHLLNRNNIQYFLR